MVLVFHMLVSVHIAYLSANVFRFVHCVDEYSHGCETLFSPVSFCPCSVHDIHSGQ
jgi:hypothetical protein